MGFFDSLFGWGGEDPRAIEQRNEGYRRQAEERAAAAAKAQQDAQLAYLNQIREDDLRREAELAAKDPTATRTAAGQVVSANFAPEWATNYVPGTITDPLEQEAYAAQEKEATDYLDRAFKRGILTSTGKAAGAKEIARQGSSVRQQLQDLSDTIINAEREKLGGFEGRARERAGSLGVGEGFDISPYISGRDTELASFNAGLGDLFKSQVPKSLFDTSSLAALGGAAQGAGNQPFSSEVVPGATVTPDEEKDPYAVLKTPQKRTTAVF